MKFGPVQKKGVFVIAYYTVFEAILKIAWCSYLVTVYKDEYALAYAEWNKTANVVNTGTTPQIIVKPAPKSAIAINSTTKSPLDPAEKLDLQNFAPRNASNPHEDYAFTGFFVHNFLFHVFSMFAGVGIYAGTRFGFRPAVLGCAIYGVIYCLDQIIMGFVIAYVAIRLLKCEQVGSCEPWFTFFYQRGHTSYPLFRGYSPLLIIFGIINAFTVFALFNYLFVTMKRTPAVRAAQKAAIMAKPGMGGIAGLPLPAPTPSTLIAAAPGASPPTNQPSKHSR